MDDAQKNLIEKVGALYHSYGVRSVTMDDVAHHLGISKKTLYSLVKDKNELVRLVVDAQIEMHRQDDEELKKMNVSALEEMLVVFKKVTELLQSFNPSYQYDLNKYYPQLSSKFLNFKQEQLFNNIKGNLIKGKNEGIYREEMNVDIIARMNTDRNISMFRSNEESHNWHTKEIFQEIFLYHIHAILNDKGRELLKQKNFFQNTSK